MSAEFLPSEPDSVPSDPESLVEMVVDEQPMQQCCNVDCLARLDADPGLRLRKVEIKQALKTETDRDRRTEFQYELLKNWTGKSLNSGAQNAAGGGGHHRFMVFGATRVCRGAVADLLGTSCRRVTSLVQWCEQGHTRPPIDMRHDSLREESPAVTAAVRMWAWVPFLHWSTDRKLLNFKPSRHPTP